MSEQAELAKRLEAVFLELCDLGMMRQTSPGRFSLTEAGERMVASPEGTPTGEGERCVTCGGAGCMNVLGEFADDDRTEVCPRCHGYGKTP